MLSVYFSRCQQFVVCRMVIKQSCAPRTRIWPTWPEINTACHTMTKPSWTHSTNVLVGLLFKSCLWLLSRLLNLAKWISTLFCLFVCCCSFYTCRLLCLGHCCFIFFTIVFLLFSFYFWFIFYFYFFNYFFFWGGGVIIVCSYKSCHHCCFINFKTF